MTITERFWSHVGKGGTSECWLWLAYCNKKGYGHFTIRPRKVKAPRFSYELAYGKIPAGLQVDHLCHNPRCVNPAHLRAVTPRENSFQSTKTNAVKKFCKRGHPFDKENTRWRKDGDSLRRACRACHRLEERRRYSDSRSGQSWGEHIRGLKGDA